MPYKPNDPRLPINPANEQLKGMFGGMPQITGADAVAPAVTSLYLGDLERLRHPVPDTEPYYAPEHFPGRLSEAATAVAGLARVLVPGGYEARAAERAERLQKRLDVGTFIALRLLQPRLTGKTNEKISWIGTHKMTDPTDTSKHPGPNHYRPATRSELSVNKRLERTKEHMRTEHNNADWIIDSYAHESGSKASGRSLLKTGAPLSHGERKHMRGTSKNIEQSIDNGNKIDKKFNKIANAKDLRGRLIRMRLARANRVSGNPTGRSKPLVEVRAAHLRKTSLPKVRH